MQRLTWSDERSLDRFAEDWDIPGDAVGELRELVEEMLTMHEGGIA